MRLVACPVWAAAAVLCLGVTARAAGDNAGNAVQLLAHAADARAAVFRTPQGARVRVKEGEVVPGTELTLRAVGSDGVELRARQSLNGHALAVHLRDGDSTDPQRLAESSRALQSREPHPANPRPVRAPGAGGKR